MAEDGGDANIIRTGYCPTCGRTFGREMHTLRRLGNTSQFACDHCGGEFIETERGMLPLNPIINVERAPTELCPVCGQRISVEGFNNGAIHRLACHNPRCRGREFVVPTGGRIIKPWFMDLNERDYKHWLDVRKAKKLEQLEILKNLPRLQNRRLQSMREDEIKRMESVINSHGFTDAYAKRLGISEDALRNSGFDPDEPKNMLSGDDLNKYRQSLGKKLKKGEEFLTEEGRAALASKEAYEAGFDKPEEWGRYLGGKYGGDYGRRKGGRIGRRYGRAGKFLYGMEKYTEKSTFSLVLALIGIVAGAILGWPFLVAFTCWAARNILPSPKKTKLVDDWKDYRLGSLFASGEGFDNRYSTGISATKSLLKIAMLFFFGWGFFTLDVPFRGILLLVFAFMAYFSLPAEFSTDEPYKFVEGLIRVPVALLLFYIFSSVFESLELGVLSLAFFLILPIAAEKENLARAIGHMGSGITANYEMFDKILFIILMGIGLWTVLGGAGMNLDVATLAGSIFLPFWIIALIGGVFSPAQTRPYTGILVLILVFVFYAGGAGEQIVGYGFFGEWWPAVHNAFGTVTAPLGDLFSTLGETFGQTWTLFTNPMGFAKGIMEGSYEPNPHGPTGSFGVEIDSLSVPAIYPGMTTMLTFSVKNVGPEKGKNVRVWVDVPDDLKDSITIGPDGGVFETKEMEKEYIIPLFFTMDTDCDRLKEGGGLRLTDRNKYIRVNVSVEYDYEVSAWMPITIISEQEWRERSQKGTFSLSKVGSHISTSPVKLSLGSFDQPLIGGESRRYYLGFNLTSAEGRDSAIMWDSVNVTFDMPAELMKYGDKVMTPICNPVPTKTGPSYVWNEFEKYPASAIFCYFPSTPNPVSPSVTYYVRAHATFRFRKWETKDTLFAFSDVCTDITIPPAAIVADSACCSNIKTGRNVKGDYIGGTGEGNPCENGWGGCRKHVPEDCASGLECRAVEGISGDICCKTGSENDAQCRDTFVNVFSKGQLYDMYCSPTPAT
ncbi:MAG: hypothetical protein JXC85_03300 [Candidatus Aenigmarchaeota archaeon]|nr:hypothetical protein [Candidatus Aenigmarchaeota archaeon]